MQVAIAIVVVTVVIAIVIVVIRASTGTGLYLTSSWSIHHLIDENGGLVETEDGLDVLINR